jgi:hypothetical protein
MKSFRSIAFDPNAFTIELARFASLLDRKSELSEKKELLPLFVNSPNLVAMLGNLHPGITRVDRIASEYDLFGDFACDFAVGDSGRNAYCFIELEDAKRNSIFTPSSRATPDWATRFEHGFSQIVDWLYKLSDTEKSDAFENRFCARSIDVMCILLVGRSAFISQPERRRILWRERHVVVHSQKIRCLTYDQLREEFSYILTTYPKASVADERLVARGENRHAGNGADRQGRRMIDMSGRRANVDT